MEINTLNLENSAKEITGKVIESINESELAESLSKGIVNALPESILNKLSLFLDAGKILLIVVAIYFVLKIIKFLWGFNDSLRLKVITKNVKEINKKMDLFLDKAGKEKKRKKK
tara:strand:- start:736 stop:1077 length:342 start_codon:yes stop_codon:yes gene_type:complete